MTDSAQQEVFSRLEPRKHTLEETRARFLIVWTQVQNTNLTAQILFQEGHSAPHIVLAFRAFGHKMNIYCGVRKIEASKTSSETVYSIRSQHVYDVRDDPDSAMLIIQGRIIPLNRPQRSDT